MEPLSIATSCVGLLSSITTLSKNLTTFVSLARQARKDVDGFSRELSSLDLCVSTLRDESFHFPPPLQRQLHDVLSNCGSVVNAMTKIIDKHKVSHLGRQIQWSMSDRDEVCRLRERLEAHKSALEITLELASLTLATSVKEDTTEIKAELATLKIQIMQLRDARVEPNPILHRYLRDSIAYAESVIDPFESASEDEQSVNTKNEALSESTVSSENFPTRWASKPDDDIPTVDAAIKRESLLAQECQRLDRLLLQHLLVPLQHRAGGVKRDLKITGHLISPGARLGNGCIDFGYKGRNDTVYLLVLMSLEIEELLLFIDHGHSLLDAPSAFLKYLIALERQKQQPKHEIAAFLLDKANIHESFTWQISGLCGWSGLWPSYLGSTALHLAAARYDSPWLIPELVKRGAIVNQKRFDGKYPMDIAIHNQMAILANAPINYIETIQILGQLGAKSTYTDETIRVMAFNTMASSIACCKEGENSSTQLAMRVASHHGLTVNNPNCSHLVKSCAGGITCEKWERKAAHVNKDLVEAYQQDILHAVHGSGTASKSLLERCR